MRVLLLAIVTLIAYEANAQNYTRDCGFRLGDQFSAGYRQFLDDEQAIEGMFSVGRRGVRITLLKEHSWPALGHISENLFFKYGYGAHAGFRYIDRYRVLNRTYELDEYMFVPLIGLDGMIGIEYRFPRFPVLVGVDIKPYFEYSTVQIFSLYLNSIGLSIKYRF